MNCGFILGQTTYIENFDNIGYPSSGLPNGGYWMYYNDIYPSQDIWDKFIPGDGKAYIHVDADISNDTDETYPYQALVFGGASENHRLEVRMKGAAVDGGLVAFIFTYTQTGEIFNEVDIELVAKDKHSAPHETLPPNGWTDARFNTWRNANENTYLPHTGSEKAVVNENGDKISLIDGEFHTYTIDWRSDEVDFFIDDVLQDSFKTNIATGWSEVIIGYRNLPWAGDFKWSGTHTLVIDYFKVEPLQPKSSLSTSSNNKEYFKIYPNPIKDEINIIIPDNLKVKKMELINIISSKIILFKNFKNKINMSGFSKGVYFLKTEFENGTISTKKILKL